MGVGGRGQTAQGFLRALFVVFAAPCIDDDLGMLQAGEPVLVQALIPEPAIERLDVGDLVGFAGFNQEELNATGMRPGQHGPAAELLAVVGSDRLGQATRLGQLIEDAHELIPAHCPLGDDGHGFMGRIVNDGQALEAAPFSRPVKHEIHRLHLVGGQRSLQGMAVGNRDLLPLAPSHLQACLGIQPIHAFVIDDLPGLPKLQIDHPSPITTMSLGEGYDFLPQDGISVCHRLVAESARTHADDPERPSLAESLVDQVVHHITP